MQISSNINSISTISWILWNSRGPPHDGVIICKLDEYIYTPHKLLVMPNIFLIYSRSLSLRPFKPQAFEILMSKSSIFLKTFFLPKGLIQGAYVFYILQLVQYDYTRYSNKQMNWTCPLSFYLHLDKGLPHWLFPLQICTKLLRYFINLYIKTLKRFH